MKRFFGALLVAAGVMIALLSGLCTLTFLPWGGSFYGPGQPYSQTPLVLAIGLPAFASGAAAIILGIVLLRGSKRS